MRPESSQMSEAPRRPRGRPRNFDPDGVEEALVEAFWRRGYEGASMDDLVAATGASRASLYRLYGDKGALMAAAVDRYAARFDARVEATLAAGLVGRAAVAETLAASADRLCDPDAPPGCLRCRATLERNVDPRIEAAVARANAAHAAGMARLLGGGPEAQAAAPFLSAVVSGMVTLAEAGASRAELQRVIERALSALPRAAP